MILTGYAIFKVNTMNTKKTAYLLMFCLVLGVSGVANAASEDTRYLIKSHSNFWKKSFSVRHEFSDGFTANLSDWQLRVARVFNIEVVPVKKLNILPAEAVLPETNVDLSGTVKGRPVARPTPSAQIPWGIRAVYNNDQSLIKTSGGKDVNVAILDTGLLTTHPDLKRRFTQCKDFTAVKAITDGSCDDKNGHGTHVAGIIAADGGADGLGIYGVAPEANIFAYKVCGNNGSCWADDIAMAIMTAVENKANIINLSLGSDSESSLIKNAVDYAVANNVLVVAAAGNDGPDVGSIDYPGANPNVIAVGAFGKAFDVPTWSSRGINSTDDPNVIEEGDVEFAAPGVIVESTWNNGGYVILSGTSMATPHITGLAAKLWQNIKDPDLVVRDTLHKLSYIMLSPADVDAYGFGFPHI